MYQSTFCFRLVHDYASVIQLTAAGLIVANRAVRFYHRFRYHMPLNSRQEALKTASGKSIKHVCAREKVLSDICFMRNPYFVQFEPSNRFLR